MNWLLRRCAPRNDKSVFVNGAAGLSPQPFILCKDRCHCEERSDEANPNDKESL